MPARDPDSDPRAAFADVLRDVDRVFLTTSQATPGWADPHAERSPREEEYSRVTDVAKYRILDARLDAWAHVLEDRGLATASSEETTAWLGAKRPPVEIARTTVLRPTQPLALSLHLATTLVDGDEFGIDVGVSVPGRPVVAVDTIPDCGCDAYDNGSDELLELFDTWFLTVAAGGVVHARGLGRRITGRLDGWSGDPDVATWLDRDTEPPSTVSRWIGKAWGL